MQAKEIVSREAWLAARKELLAEEKAFQQQRDALSEKRRDLPWVKIEADYAFQTTNGEKTLAELFDGYSQLIIQHFMFDPEWEEGCKSCSFWADSYSGTLEHFKARDTNFISCSSASLAKLQAYKRRLGWDIEWVSCNDSSFNQDFHVTFSQAKRDAGKVEYNFREVDLGMSEMPGISVFAKDDDGQVYHTYSCYSRGLDNMNTVYQYLDLLPKGRDEDPANTMSWIRRRDDYSD